jgi:catechol 2,3-dioxygenase-like lactoylglutathione lyase family enzyme
MTNHGFHHVGLATHNMEATIEFYEQILGFETQVCDIISPAAGGAIRHAFLDAGNGEMIAFMECNEVEGIADGFDTGINEGLGIRGGVVHFAFKASSVEDLHTRREDLLRKEVKVSELVDHGWCQSIYFQDPNHLQLEFCVVTEALGGDHLSDKNADTWRALARK